MRVRMGGMWDFCGSCERIDSHTLFFYRRLIIIKADTTSIGREYLNDVTIPRGKARKKREDTGTSNLLFRLNLNLCRAWYPVLFCGKPGKSYSYPTRFIPTTDVF